MDYNIQNVRNVLENSVKSGLTIAKKLIVPTALQKSWSALVYNFCTEHLDEIVSLCEFNNYFASRRTYGTYLEDAIWFTNFLANGRVATQNIDREEELTDAQMAVNSIAYTYLEEYLDLLTEPDGTALIIGHSSLLELYQYIKGVKREDLYWVLEYLILVTAQQDFITVSTKLNSLGNPLKKVYNCEATRYGMSKSPFIVSEAFGRLITIPDYDTYIVKPKLLQETALIMYLDECNSKEASLRVKNMTNGCLCEDIPVEVENEILHFLLHNFSLLQSSKYLAKLDEARFNIKEFYGNRQYLIYAKHIKPIVVKLLDTCIAVFKDSLGYSGMSSNDAYVAYAGLDYFLVAVRKGVNIENNAILRTKGVKVDNFNYTHLLYCNENIGLREDF